MRTGVVVLFALGLSGLSAGCSDDGAPRRTGGADRAATKPAAKNPAASKPADPPPGMAHWRFAGAGAALAALLEKQPRVIGFGEYHELRSSAAVQSTLHRFNTEMLEVLAGRASDLVVETWVEAGRCGEQEKRVSQDVKQVTERPQHTQNELVMMLQRAQKLAIRPHLLELRCDDYQAILKDGKEVDYEKLLQLIATKLREGALASLEQGSADRVVALYGGSLHNDLYPAAGVEDFSYAAAVDAAASGGYLEVDLYVPEYIDADPDVAKESWYPLYRELAGPDQVVLIERAPRSYVLILRRGLAREKPPALPTPPADR